MSYSRTVKAAAVQISPVLHSQSGTMEKVLKAIADAAKEGVQLIVFPETFVPYYPYFSFVLPPVLMGQAHMKLYEEAVEVPGPVTEAVSRAAREHQMVIVLGVNERDQGSLYNTQLIFDASGKLVLKRRKITPTYHERMVWGQGDGSGLQVCETAVGDIFGEQIEVTMRHHALESGCFVVNATGWLTPDQVEQIAPSEGLQKALCGGCYTAIISPEGVPLCEPIRSGEGMAIATLDFVLITKRKRMMDSVGHYARPDLLQLKLKTSPYSVVDPVSASSDSASSILAHKEPTNMPANTVPLATISDSSLSSSSPPAAGTVSNTVETSAPMPLEPLIPSVDTPVQTYA